MAGLKEKLFWEKYRPTTLRSTIILPRIKKVLDTLDDGVHSNFIFHGTSGIGKTTIANIIADKHNSLKLSGKLGIDILTDKIRKHFEGLSFSAKSGLKLIYIDEFDRASSTLQEALKGFMEEFEYARFIFTTNHLHKIDEELRSRFVEIGFNPVDKTEREFLFGKQVQYLRSVCKREGSELFKDKSRFDKLTKKYFPDLRKAIEMLQIVILTNDMSMFDADYGKGKEELYDFVMGKNLNPLVNYDYVMNNYFIDFEDAFFNLGRPFFEYLTEIDLQTILDKGAKILQTQGKYGNLLSNSYDPLVDLINYILELKEILK
jgi:replication-associated recombination protein RarA